LVQEWIFASVLNSWEKLRSQLVVSKIIDKDFDWEIQGISTERSETSTEQSFEPI